MKKLWMILGAALLLVMLVLGVANFGFAKPPVAAAAEEVSPTRIVGIMVWDQVKAEYRTETVQITQDGPPALLICEMPGSTDARPIYAVQPWQPRLAATLKREEYTSSGQ